MRIDILTILPEIFSGPLEAGMIRKAREKGLADIRVVNLRDYAEGKHRITDDEAFGGGPGMVMKPEPIVAAAEHVLADGGDGRVLIMSPAGETFDQERAWDLAKCRHLVIICGRYEGIDERVGRVLAAEEISIGDFVLTGGEIPALVVTDAVVRLIPGVLNQEQAAREDSFSAGLLEGPSYTRPREFRGLDVPEVLLSGHHAEIARWRRKEALRRTWRRRPELLREAVLSPEDKRLLMEIRREEDPL